MKLPDSARFNAQMKRAFAYILLALLLAFVLQMLGQYERNFIQKGFRTDNFERVLNGHVELLNRQIQEIECELLVSHSAWEVVMNHPSDPERGYLIFHSDSLVAWGNVMLPGNQLEYLNVKQGVRRLANGWYWFDTAQKGAYFVAGFFRIAEVFPFQNEYLQDSFHESFHLPLAPAIVLDQNNYSAVPIHGADRTYLFSLKFSGAKSLSYSFIGLNLAIWLLFLCFSVLAVWMLMRNKWFIQLQLASFWWSVIAFYGLYHLLLRIDFAPSLLRVPIFSSELYGMAWWLPSMSFFIVASFYFMVLSYGFFKFFEPGLALNSKIKRFPALAGVLGLVLLYGYFSVANRIIEWLVAHSNLLSIFVGPLDFSVAAICKLLIMCFVWIGFVFLSDRILQLLISHLRRKHFLWLLLPFGAVMSVFYWLLGTWMNFVGLGFFLVFISLFYWVKCQRSIGLGYSHMVWIVFLFALYSVFLLSYWNTDKEHKNRALLIQNLSFKLMREDDPLAEMFLQQIDQKIQKDPIVAEYVVSDSKDDQKLTEYLRNQYFQGYFTRYDLQVVPCFPQSGLLIGGIRETHDCFRYFDDMIKVFGVALNGLNHFCFLKDDDGRASYFGQFNYPMKDGRNARLFIEINSNPNYVGLGYPELLINQNDRSVVEQFNGYAYAKYVNGTLVSRFGEFNYHLSSQWVENRANLQSAFFVSEGFTHLLYSAEPNQMVIMSYPTLTTSQILVNYSLVFIFYFLVSSLVLLFIRPHSKGYYNILSLQERIQISFVMLLVVLLIVMCVVSVVYSVQQFNLKNYGMMSQKLKSVMLDFQQQVGFLSHISDAESEHLNSLLEKSANVFFTDINFYSTDGRLLGTSREELYSKGLASKLMNNHAFCSLAHDAVPEFMGREQIGKLKFLSGYIPFYNYDNQLLGYLNIPYFVGSNVLREQISAIVVAIINAYLFFILIAVGFAFVLSRHITYPLLVMGESIRNIQLGKANAKIKYTAHDEIGELVGAYNSMLDELNYSVAKLASSEREMAWREMAKQIAHEINNPLTPMKLSVQYLQKAWDEQKEDYDKFMKRVTQTLIEQIDQLSVIASEFSNFAKMPDVNPEYINIVDKLLNSIALFEQSEHAELFMDEDSVSKAIVYADGEQFLSVFNNLFKNSIQALDHNRKGIVRAHVAIHQSDVRISISDNGRGVPVDVRDKMFKPNFTTKSSGMGLGLAIVQNIVHNAKGSIWFETEENVGTTFFILLPLADKHQLERTE